VKVLHVCGCYLPATEWGGPPPAVAAYVAALRGAGVACEVFTTTARAGPSFPRIAPGTREVDGTPVTYFPALDRFRSFIAPGLLPALSRRVGEFDLVHVHMMWAFPGIVAARAAERRSVPYLLTPHGSLDPWALGQFRLLKKAFLLLLENRTMRRAAAIHFTAQAERALAPADVRALPSVVVPNVVDARAFEAIVRAPATDRLEVLVLGRIHPMKGFDVLLPAWRRVVAAEPRAHLVVAGRDEAGTRGWIEARAREAGLAGSITFTGHLDEAGRAEALSRAAVLAAPSHRENFGLAVAEAMAAGLPVVVSDRVNICDDVAAARGGVVVPLEERALADALLRVLADTAGRGEMGARGRALVAERYAPAAVGPALRRAYEDLTRRASGAQPRSARSAR
jgi:glycosyltransferase involved in cell wall biosynthesis